MRAAAHADETPLLAQCGARWRNATVPRSLPATAACARGSGPMTASKRHLSHVAEGSEPLRGYTASAPALAPASGVSASATAAPEAGVGLRQEGRPGQDLCPGQPRPCKLPPLPSHPSLGRRCEPSPGRALPREGSAQRPGLGPLGALPGAGPAWRSMRHGGRTTCHRAEAETRPRGTRPARAPETTADRPGQVPSGQALRRGRAPGAVRGGGRPS